MARWFIQINKFYLDLFNAINNIRASWETGQKESTVPTSEGGPGTPGKKTQAKEKLFQYILTLIKDANGDADFNIYENTRPETGRGRWRVPYRHWKFVPAEFREKKA